MEIKRITTKWYSIGILSTFFLIALFCQPVGVHARDLVIAYEGDPDTLDMTGTRHEPIAEAIAVNIMERFFDQTTEGEIIPGLATEWKMSPDNKVLDIKLRKGVKFHSGDPLTSEDVSLARQPERPSF